MHTYIGSERDEWLLGEGKDGDECVPNASATALRTFRSPTCK